MNIDGAQPSDSVETTHCLLTSQDFSRFLLYGFWQNLLGNSSRLDNGKSFILLFTFMVGGRMVKNPLSFS